jgi:hypothetical protein
MVEKLMVELNHWNLVLQEQSQGIRANRYFFEKDGE